MTIRYCSDLHLEFRANKEFLQQYPLESGADVLILAGDIILFKEIEKHNDFFDYVADNFGVTYWIPGNHEYYHYDLAEKSGVLNEKVRENVFLVNNQIIVKEDIRFVFSTLWSWINPAKQQRIDRGLSDFQVIKYNGERFTPATYNKIYTDSKDFITKALQQNIHAKTVVVTHHVPTFQNYPEQYRMDVLNEAFAVELEVLIEASNVDFWIYGHHHHYTPEFVIGKTRLITNQLGYVQQEEHLNFNPGALIEL